MNSSTPSYTAQPMTEESTFRLNRNDTPSKKPRGPRCWEKSQHWSTPAETLSSCVPPGPLLDPSCTAPAPLLRPSCARPAPVLPCAPPAPLLRPSCAPPAPLLRSL
ncbi:hypothetical protein K523DRAFT_357559 [Schizophyllum commune Tattone D]|nr:hypothetical protein K523DRAFT_357559 [Schizophyllum commune Tattone D]